MENKDVEKQFEEAAESIELRSFSQRWDVIKKEIKEQPKTAPAQKQSFFVKRWRPIAAACAVMLSVMIIVPSALNYKFRDTMYVSSGETGIPGTNSPETELPPEENDLLGVTEEKSYFVNGAHIKYKLKMGADGVYRYIVNAERRGVRYYLEHLYSDGNVETFLDEFFKSI